MEELVAQVAEAERKLGPLRSGQVLVSAEERAEAEKVRWRRCRCCPGAVRP